MINGFILVSVLCLKGVHQNAMVAGVHSEKVNCSSTVKEVYKTRMECEAKNEKLTETIEVNRSEFTRNILVMPGSACVEINRIVGETIDWNIK